MCTDPTRTLGSELDVRLRDQNDTLMLDAGSDIDVNVNGGDGDDNITSIGESRDTISGYLGADSSTAGPAPTLFSAQTIRTSTRRQATRFEAGKAMTSCWAATGPDVFDEQATANGSDLIERWRAAADVVTYEHRTNPVTVNLDWRLLTHRIRL